MKIKKFNNLLSALLMAAVAALSSPAAAQTVTCGTAVQGINDYYDDHNLSSADRDYEGCCRAIRLNEALQRAANVCQYDNDAASDINSHFAAGNASPSQCNALSGGSSSCTEFPAVVFPVKQPVHSKPGGGVTSVVSSILSGIGNYIGRFVDRAAPIVEQTLQAAGESDEDDDTVIYIVGGVAVAGLLWGLSSSAFPESGFTAHPIASFQNDDGESLSRYGARIEYRRPDSPFSLRWSAEGLRGGGSDSMSALFGGEWRGEVWTLGGEAAQRDSDIAFALRVGTAFERAGWTLRLDAESAAWRNGAHGFASDAELLVGMERAF